MSKEDFLIGLIIILIFSLIIFSGVSGLFGDEKLSTKAKKEMIQYKNINSYVIADEETHILYYMLPDHYMCPYYSKDGNLCKYEDGKIIEVNADEDSD